MVGRVNGAVALRLGAFEVEFDRVALDVLDRHRQTRFYHAEAGGQLFGRAGGTRWRVTCATGPGAGDRRFRFGYRPDRARQQREIDDHHARGLNFLGDWHTHPEAIPTPSHRDFESIADIVRQSTLALPGLLLCIVGREPFPRGIWLSMHGKDGSRQDGRPLPIS